MATDESEPTGSEPETDVELESWDDDAEFGATSGSSLALFDGDQGGLDPPQRHALVTLLKQRFITAESHPADWKTIVARPDPIRSRLNDLYLELVLDRERLVAYKRQASSEDSVKGFPTLLHDRAWPREDTVLIVILRVRFRSEQAAGMARVFVERDDLVADIDQYRPDTATDRVRDTERVSRAIERLNRDGLLVGKSGSSRFEISPAIEVMLPLEKLTLLLRWIKGDGQGPEVPAPEGGDVA